MMKLNTAFSAAGRLKKSILAEFHGLSLIFLLVKSFSSPAHQSPQSHGDWAFVLDVPVGAFLNPKHICFFFPELIAGHFKHANNHSLGSGGLSSSVDYSAAAQTPF